MLYNCIISGEDNGHNRRTSTSLLLSHLHTSPAALWAIVSTTNSQLSTQMVKLSCPEFVLIIRDIFIISILQSSHISLALISTLNHCKKKIMNGNNKNSLLRPSRQFQGNIRNISTEGFYASYISI